MEGISLTQGPTFHGSVKKMGRLKKNGCSWDLWEETGGCGDAVKLLSPNLR